MPRLVRVAVPVPLIRLFDYLLDDSLPAPQVGCRVRVPFARREVTGVVLELPTSSDMPAEQLKPLAAVLDEAPLLDPGLIADLMWAARYYQHPPGEVFETALPLMLRRAAVLPESGTAALRLSDAGSAAMAQATTRIGKLGKQLLAFIGECIKINVQFRQEVYERIYPSFGLEKFIEYHHFFGL